MSDVDISDKTNTSAALNFLKEIEDKPLSEDSSVALVPTEAISFKKTSILKRNIRNAGVEEPDEEIEKPKLKGSTLVMPEYVVGQKNVTTNKRRKLSSKASKSQGKKELTLSHLQEEDPIDDDGDG